VLRCRRLRGATSSTLFGIELANRGNVVLRLLTNERWLAEEPAAATHEAKALDSARRAHQPAPRVIAVDGDGSRAGLPAVLMTHLDGDVWLPKRPRQDWISVLARTLAGVHRHRAPTLEFVYRSWTPPTAIAMPAWSRRPRLWQRAIEVHAEGPPRAAHVLLHRDYHPTNVLWRAGRVTGVVDWINACRGPRGVDVAHCRANLTLMYGATPAANFLDSYASACGGYRQHPYWDLDTAFDWAHEPRYYRPWREFGLPAVSRQTLCARLEDHLEEVLSHARTSPRSFASRTPASPR